VIRTILVFISLSLFHTQLFAKEIKRIVALSPSSVEMLFEIGVGDRVVAAVERADFPEAAKKIPRVGNYVGLNIEKIVSLEPDLIVAWTSGNKQADIKKLESLGLNVIHVDPKNLETVSKDMRRLGKAIGVEDAAEEAANKFEREHSSIKSHYAEKRKVRVFYQLWYDPIRTVGDKSWVQSLIHDCNGENIFKKAEAPYPVVSVESVLVKNPEVMIMASHSDASKSRDALWKKWPTISAVKNNLLEVVDGSKLLRAGPRATEGLKLLCESIDKARKL